MGTSLGPKYLPYRYMDPLGVMGPSRIKLRLRGLGGLGFREVWGFKV